MRKYLAALFAAAALASAGAAAIVPAAASAAPATSVAMHYEGGSAGPGMYYA